MTSQMFNAIAAVTGQGQNANSTPAQWGSSQYNYSGGGGGGGSTGGGGGSSSAYHVSAALGVVSGGGAPGATGGPACLVLEGRGLGGAGPCWTWEHRVKYSGCH